jgi:hypothetical protein
VTCDLDASGCGSRASIARQWLWCNGRCVHALFASLPSPESGPVLTSALTFVGRLQIATLPSREKAPPEQGFPTEKEGFEPSRQGLPHLTP